ncbi:hypothetical protein LINPERHAP1_LOCUS40706 [Linum perenne]
MKFTEHATKISEGTPKMICRNPLLLLFFFIVSSSAELDSSSSNHGTFSSSNRISVSNGGFRRRVLLGFKETPSGSNVTFNCAPSGACVPCQYSEKSELKYRCSETGYRIPLKCKEIKDDVKLEKKEKSEKSRSDMEASEGSGVQEASDAGRNLEEDSSKPKGGSQAYITYRSCIPPVDEEKVSVLGFEVCHISYTVASILFRNIWCYLASQMYLDRVD